MSVLHGTLAMLWLTINNKVVQYTPLKKSEVSEHFAAKSLAEAIALSSPLRQALAESHSGRTVRQANSANTPVSKKAS